VTQQTLHALQNEAANFAIQSTASDLTLISAMRINPELRRYGGHVINLVHDSILIEVSEDYDTQTIGSLVTDIMVDTPARLLKGRVPFEASMSVGRAWGSMEERK
jgi:DNA polymerase I-like protein with 3'-5' exonuclease and polymerase domains